MKKTLGDHLKEWRDGTERNQKEPTIETIGSIYRLFGVSADWLLGILEDLISAVKSIQQPKDESYWRNLVSSQQDTITKLTSLLSKGRAKVATLS